jgi:L-threonylcarbamoyladenylate synthase
VTRILRTSADAPDERVVREAARLICAGEVVAIPTETVYGLAADATNPAAVARIFEAKGRPAWNPLIVHLADVEALPTAAREVPQLAMQLARAFWPGPLTLVLRRGDAIPDIVTGGRATVGIRVPSHPVARAIIRAAGVPVAAPSANRFTEVSPTTTEHVVAGLGGRIPLVVDAGPTSVGIESTVIDLTTDPPTLLRPGGISREQLEPLTGLLAIPAPALRPDEVRPAPGMTERHYAPRARLVLFRSGESDTAEREATTAREAGEIAVVVTTSLGSRNPHTIRLPADPAEYAQQLYATLHALDARGVTIAWWELPPHQVSWEGVRDRLERAAAR